MPGARGSGGLPFGAVMATGAVAQLADAAGVGWLRLPAVAIATLVALYVAVRGVRGFRAWWRGGAGLGFGHFTVPVGLAVIGVGFAPMGPAVTAIVGVAVVLAWAWTAVLLAVVVVPVFGGVPLKTVNGVWFIAPAALLADAAGAVAWGVGVGGSGAVTLRLVAVVCVWAGVGGYVVLLALAATRFIRHGLREAPRAAWWIVVGCGGLAADALGHVAAEPGAPGRAALQGSAIACWAIATVVLVPTGALSLRHLARVRRLSDAPAWPPAFSTGVYALGTAAVAAIAPGVALGWLVAAVAVETIVVWAVTGALRMRGSIRTARVGTRES